METTVEGESVSLDHLGSIVDVGVAEEEGVVAVGPKGLGAAGEEAASTALDRRSVETVPGRMERKLARKKADKRLAGGQEKKAKEERKRDSPNPQP